MEWKDRKSYTVAKHCAGNLTVSTNLALKNHHMKKIILICIIVFSTVNCQKKTNLIEDKTPNEIIEKHNQSLKNISSILNVEDKDLLTKINEDVFSENFNPQLIREEIERSKKYYDDLSLAYFSVNKRTTYSLDSISIKNNYDQKKMAKIEKMKINLGVFEGLITRFKIEVLFVTSKYNQLVDIRTNCHNKLIGKQVSFSDDSCLEKFNSSVVSLNEHLTKLNEIKTNIENFPLND